MHIDTLPTEILDTIISFCSKKDQKSVTLTTQLFRIITIRYLWKEPVFTKQITANELIDLIHLPIRRIDLSQLKWDPGDGSRFFKIFRHMEELEEVAVEKCSIKLNVISVK